MPELPEVETTRLGLLPVVGQTIRQVTIRHYGLRWPVPEHLPQTLAGQTLVKLQRRAKYLLAEFAPVDDMAHPIGSLLLHLGMSGRLCLLSDVTPAQKHDHLDLSFMDGQIIRLRDPRRFGAALWLAADAEAKLNYDLHPLLAHLGPEPLAETFTAEYLFQALRSRTCAIKVALMDAKLVVGVGNIYANEALFRAGIHPTKSAQKLSRQACERLVDCVQTTLQEALAAGGSTLRDFFGTDGQPGYFQQSYYVYGRAGQPCQQCHRPIQMSRVGQRSTFYCTHCQR